MAETDEEREFLLDMYDSIKEDLFDGRYRELDLTNDESLTVHLLRVFDDLQFLLEERKLKLKEKKRLLQNKGIGKVVNYVKIGHVMNSEGIEISFTEDGKNLTFRELFFLMRDHPINFHNALKEAVKSLDYPAVFLEFPKINDGKLSERNVCTIIKAHSLLNTEGNPEAFSLSCTEKVCKTENLSKDAILIIPNLTSQHDYGHLYKFLMNCDDNEEIRLFWKAVGESIFKQLDLWSNIWISTSGLGIPWLHLRISRTPKYYHYTPYTV
jgi:hypothetical protein